MRSLGVALALVGTLACKTTVYSVVNDGVPSITFFAASPGTITQGAATALSWRVSNATALSIDNGVGDVTGRSAVSVSPTATTTYTLTATGTGGTRTQAVTVTVTAPQGVPSIAAFTATPNTVTAGGSSQLAWSVSGATSITIDNGVGDVTGRNSASVSPTATTTYKLTAAGPGGNATAQATVTVSAQAAPVISSFTASPASINAGGASQLAWSVSNATSLSVDNGVGDVTGRSSTSVSPAATTTYRLTATGAGGTTATATATVTVNSANPPVIASFTAAPASISAGGSSQLTWSVSNATSVSIDNGVGDVTTRSSASVSPTTTTLYTLTATGVGGTKTATATVTVSGGSTDATLVVDTSQGRSPISPYVYGYNPPEAGKATWTPGSFSAPAGTTIWREGGNRTTAYNWTNNYSNAGNDYGPFSSDNYMGTPADGAGHAVVPIIDYAKTNGIAALVTVPIQGWVAKDASGFLSLTSALTDHFVASKPRKGSAFTTSPSPTSNEVYQDEFASFIAQRVGSGREIHISLDNEPDLWFGTHKEIERTQPTYASYLARYVESAAAIKDAVPGAILYGPASYGWWGYVNFSGASDAPSNTGADHMFIDWFLAQVNTASSQKGVRLLDVLDLHYYSEARSTGCSNASDDGIRVFSDTDNAIAKRNLDCVVAARVHAARSFGDPSFVETSSLTKDSTAYSSLGQAVQLVPRMKAKIAAGYPGTKLSLSEYNFGGGDHVSGAIAEAEALGIMGRDGAYAAMVWEAGADSSFIRGAFKHYRNYDGAGKNFGDTSVSATSSDKDHVGVYASVDAASDGRLVLVIVHRPTLSNGSLDLKARTVKIQWTHSRALTQARAWQTTSSSATPQAISAPAVSGNAVTLTLPGMSVTTLELTP